MTTSSNINIREPFDFVFQTGDTKQVFRDCIVTSYTVEIHQDTMPVPSLGSRIIESIIPTTQIIECKLEFMAKDIQFDVICEKTKVKIRNKRVKDCEIEELLFAIREKMKCQS